jgi:WD repeat and SOF domain-containing protein 1
MEAFNFTVANEDHNLYTFDMRNLSKALNILKDHVSAVMDVDYSPTGEELVSAGYDKTIRIYNARQGRSRDVYHTKRMQRVFTVAFSGDSKYIFSGSDDGNIRLWKTNASEKIGPMSKREKLAVQYNEKLKERYANVPEVRKVLRQRHVPKPIYSAQKIKRIQIDSRKEKQEREIKHSAQGEVKRVPERMKNVLAVQK